MKICVMKKDKAFFEESTEKVIKLMAFLLY